MPNPQLLAYIQHNLQAGYTEQQLRATLLANGWQQSAIDEAFASLQATAPAAVMHPAPTQPVTKATKPKVNSMYLLGGIAAIFVIIGIIILIVGGNAPTATQNQEILANQEQTGQQSGQPPQEPNQQIPGVASSQTAPGQTFEQLSPMLCSDLICFEEKYASCEEGASFIVSQPASTYYYTIISKSPDGCLVRTTLVSNSDPNNTDTQMMCVYDNTMPFQQSIQLQAPSQRRSCAGPLIDQPLQ